MTRRGIERKMEGWGRMKGGEMPPVGGEVGGRGITRQDIFCRFVKEVKKVDLESVTKVAGNGWSL